MDAIKTTFERQKEFEQNICTTKARCEQRVAQVTQECSARIADLNRQIEEARQKAEDEITVAETTRDVEVTSLTKTVQSLASMGICLRELDAQFVSQTVSDFRCLDESQVVALMRRMQISIDEPKLKGITGEILAEINEGDIEPYFGIKETGPRRRLMSIIRKLKQHASFDTLYVPSPVECKEGDELPAVPYTWNVSHVLEWLRREKLTDMIEVFRREQISGDVLMDLNGVDLRQMGVSQLGPRIMCEKRIGELRKPYSEPSDTNPLPAEQVQAILRQHVEYDQQAQGLIERMRSRLEGDTRPVPGDFLCPITRHVMEDPVVAADSFTYERISIEAWFIEHETSPMTRRVIAKTLIPNTSLRRMIMQFIDDRPAA